MARQGLTASRQGMIHSRQGFGSGTEDPGEALPEFLYLDNTESKLFFSSETQNSIWASNLSGGAWETINDSVNYSFTINRSARAFYGIRIVPTGTYPNQSWQSVIYKADYDGSTETAIVQHNYVDTGITPPYAPAAWYQPMIACGFDSDSNVYWHEGENVTVSGGSVVDHDVIYKCSSTGASVTKIVGPTTYEYFPVPPLERGVLWQVCRSNGKDTFFNSDSTRGPVVHYSGTRAISTGTTSGTENTTWYDNATAYGWKVNPSDSTKYISTKFSTQSVWPTRSKASDLYYVEMGASSPTTVNTLDIDASLCGSIYNLYEKDQHVFCDWSNYVYYIEVTTWNVKRINLDGTGKTTLITSFNDGVRSIAVDFANSYIYALAQDAAAPGFVVKRTDLTGGSATTLIDTT